MPPKSTIGLALAAYKLWRRLPPAQRAARVRSGAQARAEGGGRGSGRCIKSRKTPLGNAQRLADDPLLLDEVRRRVALARARAPRPADVAQRHAVSGSASSSRWRIER